MTLVSNAISESLSGSVVSSIVFISDLHFDYVDGEFCEEQSEEIKNTFISYIKDNYYRSIICILGDCFNDWRRVLLFVKELEKAKIKGFFVLGNHDYWNDGTQSYREVLDIFNKETENHVYFRLLTTGRKYYVGELCFIGDTGWTSFVQNGKRTELSQFLKLPETVYMKNFSPEEIISMHNEWIKFANDTLGREERVVVLTHYPMVSFSKKPKDAWWSSETELIESKKCWKLFGHTHNARKRKINHVSVQRGYENKDKKSLEEYGHLGYSQYNERDFGLLIKVEDSNKLQVIDLSPVLEFYSPIVVENPETQIELVREICGRGYKRSSKNWEILAELATDPYKYIKNIKKKVKEYEKSNYIGYRYTFGLSEKTISAIHTAICSLEKTFETNDFSNPVAFVTSAIISGYVYNYMAEEIDQMRPIDYYDIVRFFLVFQTMKKYNFGFEDIMSIRKHKSRSLQLANVLVGLPSLNQQCMTIDEAYACLKGTPLLQETNMIESFF